MSELEPTRTCSNPTATEILRRLLDELGVEWQAPASFDGTARYDTVAGGYWFHEFNGKITIHGLDPEQAIAATLGPCNCSDNCTNGERTETCHIDVLNTGDCAGYECSEYIMHCNGCGHEFGHVLYNEDGDVWMSEPPNYCPNCGRRVEVFDG